MPSISKPCNARPHDKTILRKLSIPLNRIAHPTAKVQKKTTQHTHTQRQGKRTKSFNKIQLLDFQTKTNISP